MDGELPENGADDVRVENVVLRPLFGERFNGLLILAQDCTSNVKINNLLWLARWRGNKHSSSFH
jgi:hypothetical protein